MPERRRNPSDNLNIKRVVFAKARVFERLTGSRPRWEEVATDIPRLDQLDRGNFRQPVTAVSTYDVGFADRQATRHQGNTQRAATMEAVRVTLKTKKKRRKPAVAPQEMTPQVSQPREPVTVSPSLTHHARPYGRRPIRQRDPAPGYEEIIQSRLPEIPTSLNTRHSVLPSIFSTRENVSNGNNHSDTPKTEEKRRSGRRRRHAREDRGET